MKKRYIFLALLIVHFHSVQAQSPVLIKNMDTITIDVNSGSYPGPGVSIGSYFYFAAENNNGRELWRTDGTTTGTTQVRDINSLFPGSSTNPRLLTKVGDSLYFFGGTGLHLYKYVPATGKISEQYVDGGDNEIGPTEMIASGNDLYFASSTGSGDGVELIRFNTVSNNYTLTDINSGSASSYPHNLTVVGSKMYFAASDGTDGTELWIANLNTYSVSMVKDIASGSDSSNPHDLIAYNSKLFFAANDGTNGDELWASSGTSLTTVLYQDINTNTGDGSNPAHIYGRV